MRGRQDVHSAAGRGVRLLKGITMLAVLLAALPSAAGAQGTFKIERVINNWPTIELYSLGHDAMARHSTSMMRRSFVV
jgi:hypothetical protein